MFVAAVKLRPDQWEAFLDRACGGDEGLHRQVGELLQAHRQAGSFLDQPVAHLEATGDFDPAGNGVALAFREGPGEIIGPDELQDRDGDATEKLREKIGCYRIIKIRVPPRLL